MAGALLRRVRKRAGLSQVELAARAGVTQSVMTAYESGHRQPAVPALAALVDAAGYDLVMGVRRQPGHLQRLSGPVGRRVRRHRNDLIAAAESHGIGNLRVFGSVARGEDRPDSDVHLLADLPADLSLFGLSRALELGARLGARARTRGRWARHSPIWRSHRSTRRSVPASRASTSRRRSRPTSRPRCRPRSTSTTCSSSTFPICPPGANNGTRQYSGRCSTRVATAAATRWCPTDPAARSARARCCSTPISRSRPHRSSAISLYALEVPAAGTSTHFADAVGAARKLRPSTVEAVQGRHAVHVYPLTGRARRPPIPCRHRRPGRTTATHPVLMPHPRTHEPVLFVGQMQTDAIVGLDERRQRSTPRGPVVGAVRPHERVHAPLARRRSRGVGQPGGAARPRRRRARIGTHAATGARRHVRRATPRGLTR